MKRKIILISIIGILCVSIIIGYCVYKGRISKIQVSEDLGLESENDLLDMEISDNLENVEDDPEESIEENSTETDLEEITEVKEKGGSIQQQVKSSSNSTSKVETKSEVETTVNKETTTTKENIPSTVSEPKVENKINETPTRCTNNNNHSMDVGNSGKWFSSKSEAIAYYNSQISYWGNLWETEAIDDTKYYKNCPSGYEVWNCVYCSKWTINFYYR